MKDNRGHDGAPAHGANLSQPGATPAGVGKSTLVQQIPAEIPTTASRPGADQPVPAAPTAPKVPKNSLDDLEAQLGDGAALGGREAGLAQNVGADPAALRVHTGLAAAQAAAEHSAVAFAAGNHLVMGSGAPAPGTLEGDALLRHEAAHVAQQQEAARDPAQRRKPIGDEEPPAERNAEQVALQGTFGSNAGDVMRTGVQIQRGDPQKAGHGMGPARYHAIELRLKNLIAEKRDLLDGTGSENMAAIDAEIDKLIGELRVDFGVQLDKGKILNEAASGKNMLVVDGRIVLNPSGPAHYMGERLGAKLEIDQVPPGETLQIGWRWREPGASRAYRFLVIGPAFAEKTRSQEMELDTPFWGLVPDAVEKAKGMEIVAEIYLGKTDHPTKTFSTGFIAMPERPIGELKIVGAPDRVVQDSHVELGIGPWTPDYRRYSIDWFVDDVPVAIDQLGLRHKYGKLGKHTTRAEVYQVKRSFGIRDKQFVQRAATTFEVMTDEQYGTKFLTELETSPFRPKPVGIEDTLTSGDKSLIEIQHRIDQGGNQQKYWEARLKAQKERLGKIRELAPDHAAVKPLPMDPTKLDPGGSYSGPINAALVMSSGGGAQPLALHLTIHNVGGVWNARLIDSTSKKVLKADGAGSTPLAAYAAVFETWRTDNEYPTGGHIVHRFAPPRWSQGASFSTTTSWKKAKDWVDGIIQVGGFLVGALLLADPDPTISKLLGGVLMAAVVARSSIAIYERIRNGGDALSTENILDSVAIITAFLGIGGGVLRNAGIKAVNPTTYRVGNWMIMSAVAGDAGTFIYASSEALASLNVIQSDPTMDDGQKSGEMLRIMASLFVTGAMLIASNRDLIRNGLKPNDFVKSDLQPGMKPELDVGARLDAEYELKKAGQWTKETSKLTDEAVLDTVFTHRSRQEFESSLAKKAGATPAAALADALGNDAFIQLHHTLSEETMVALAKGIVTAKVGEVHKALGTGEFAALVKDFGVPTLKQLTNDLSGAQIKKLIEDLGRPLLKEIAAELKGKDLHELITKLTRSTAKELLQKLGAKGMKEVHGTWKAQGTKELVDAIAVQGMEEIGAKGLANIDRKLTPAEIKQWLADLSPAKMKKVSEVYGGDAMKHYGKDWMKEYKGFTSDTEHHATVGDGLDRNNGVSGCHDYDQFMNQFVNPVPKQIHVHGQTVSGDLVHFDYSVMKADGSGHKAAHRDKTTMKGLQANWGMIQPKLEKAVEATIKNKIFPRSPGAGPQVTVDGVKWNLFFRDWQIASIFPIL